MSLSLQREESMRALPHMRLRESLPNNWLVPSLSVEPLLLARQRSSLTCVTVSLTVSQCSSLTCVTVSLTVSLCHSAAASLVSLLQNESHRLFPWQREGTLEPHGVRHQLCPSPSSDINMINTTQFGLCTIQGDQKRINCNFSLRDLKNTKNSITQPFLEIFHIEVLIF